MPKRRSELTIQGQFWMYMYFKVDNVFTREEDFDELLQNMGLICNLEEKLNFNLRREKKTY